VLVAGDPGAAGFAPAIAEMQSVFDDAHDENTRSTLRLLRFACRLPAAETASENVGIAVGINDCGREK
jgi:hypothetical protein